MIKNYAFVTDETMSDIIREDIERKPLKVYFDIKEKTYVCHPVCLQGERKRHKKTLMEEKFEEIRKEYSAENKPKWAPNSSYKDDKYSFIEEKLMSLKCEFMSEEKRKIDEENKLREDYILFNAKFGANAFPARINKISDNELDKKVVSDILSLCEKKKIDEYHNEKARKKRFDRKVGFNKDILNYYFTVTYDPKLFETSEEWKNSLFKYFANCSTRKGVKILGGIEYGEETGRIHFHGLASFPDEYWINDGLEQVSHFSKKQNCWETFMQSKHIRKRFGINDFKKIENFSESDFLKTINYVSEYATKQGGTMYYSRGLPDSAPQNVSADDLYYEFDDGIVKYYPIPGFKAKMDNLKLVMRRKRFKDEQVSVDNLPFPITS